MRSCTGWPSGTWIDEPRRTAPDGSNFQLQHWTHVFDYALVCGDGDWRQAQIPARSAQFSTPAARGPCTTRPATAPGARLAPSARCCTSSRPTRCSWARSRRPAIRWRPAAPRRSTPARWRCGWWKPPARDTRVAIGSEVGKLRTLQLADLLEKPTRAQTDRSTCTAIRSPPCWPASSAQGDSPATGAQLAPNAEAAQPLYARYWLHNRGPAPLGGLPAVAHLHPQRLTAEPGDEVVLRLTAASDCSDSALDGAVTLVCPHGWSATPAELPFTLASGEHLETDVVADDSGCAPSPGCTRCGRSCALTGGDAPAAWRQVVEDVCVVDGRARPTSCRSGATSSSGPAEVDAGRRRLGPVGRHCRHATPGPTWRWRPT